MWNVIGGNCGNIVLSVLGKGMKCENSTLPSVVTPKQLVQNLAENVEGCSWMTELEQNWFVEKVKTEMKTEL